MFKSQTLESISDFFKDLNQKDSNQRADEVYNFFTELHQDCDGVGLSFWEIHGTFRFFGHPFVSYDESSEKTQKVTTSAKYDDYVESVGVQIASEVKRSIMQG